MKMVFSSEKNIITGDKVIIRELNDYKHLRKVQRIKIGEEIYFFDTERNIKFKCKVVEFGNNEILLRVVDSEIVKKPKPEIVIIQSLIQKGTFEDELNRLSELGVDLIQPIISKHSQNFEFNEKYLERLKRISLEGAKTVGSVIFTKVLKPFSITKNFNDFEKFVKSFDNKTKFILFTDREINGTSLNFLEIIQELKEYERIVFCVGSEGGFTQEEEDKIASYGFIPVNLGKEILLRSDTVCIGVSFTLRLLRFQ